MRYSNISEKEFIRKILTGQKYFRGISLQRRLSANDLEELREYLKGQNFTENPIIISDSEIRGIQLSGLNLSYVDAKETDFTGTDFTDANLYGANFRGAILKGAIFRKAILTAADLTEALLSGAECGEANLREANLYRTHLGRACFEGADLRDVRNLEFALGLHQAYFSNTIVTPKDKEISDQESAKHPKFIVEEK